MNKISNISTTLCLYLRTQFCFDTDTMFQGAFTAITSIGITKTRWSIISHKFYFIFNSNLGNINFSYVLIYFISIVLCSID